MLKFAMFDAKKYDIASFDRNLDPSFISIKYYDTKLTADTVHLAKGCDGVIVFVNDTLDKTVIDELYALGVRLIALRCAGFNNVDTRAAFGKIHIVRVPAYSPYAVAEHAMALLLTLNRKTHKAYIRTRDFNFSLYGLTGFDLHGKTVGVIGTGKIGKVFIDICRGFGMNVIAYDAFPDTSGDINYVGLDTLFEQSDIISLHCPLTNETRHMIDTDALKKMKKSCIIINTSRGGLIHAEALLAALKEGKISGAALDVYEEEGDIFFEDRSDIIVQDDTLSRLISLPNVIVTSHQAFLTQEALNNIAQTTLENIRDFALDKPLDNELCYHCMRKEDCRKKRQERCF